MWCKSLEVLNPYEALKEANMPDLKPCPFCGGNAELRVQEVKYGVCGAWVYCTKCKAKTNYINTHKTVLHKGSLSTPLTPESRANGIKKAVKAWNHRAGEEEV